MIQNREAEAIKRLLLSGESLACVARLFRRAEATIRALRKRNFSSVMKRRKVAPHVAKRRQLVEKYSKKVSTKEHRKWCTYGSSRSIKFVLKSKESVIVSDRTIRRDLKKLQLNYRVRRPVPTREKKDIEARKAFARRVMNIDPKRIVFTDESWLTCNERTGRGQWVKKGQKPFPIERKNRYNVATVQVWGAIGWNYRSPLIFFPRSKIVEGEKKTWTLNGPKYIRRCLSVAAVKNKIQRPEVLLQQDGARAHCNSVVKAYLTKQKINVLEPWPANSPDLNMIESVWNTLKGEIGRTCPLTFEDLKAEAQKAWEGIPVSTMNAHVMQFSKQIRSVAATC